MKLLQEEKEKFEQGLFRRQFSEYSTHSFTPRGHTIWFTKDEALEIFNRELKGKDNKIRLLEEKREGYRYIPDLSMREFKNLKRLVND